MPIFKCENAECIKHTEVDDEPVVRFTWSSENMRLESPYDKCPVCGSHRNVIKKEGVITMPWFKSEDSRNYDNKKIKRYENEYNPADDKPVALNQENIRKATGGDRFRIGT